MLIYAGHKVSDIFHCTAQGQNLVLYMSLNNKKYALFRAEILFYAEKVFHGPQ
jgi:hypothetical protein